jgi:hypothetical protein
MSSPDYVKLKFENIEDHKKFEVAYMWIVASVDRATGELTLFPATKKILREDYGMVPKNEIPS